MNEQELEFFNKTGVDLTNIKVITSTKKLSLTDRSLNFLPETIGNLSNLEELYLSNNNLKTLPETIGNLKNLKDLYLGSNKLTSLPDSITNLNKLERFDVGSNYLESLPKNIGNLIKLKYIGLDNNNFTSIPHSFGKLKNLVEIGITKNTSMLAQGVLTHLLKLNKFKNLEYITLTVYSPEYAQLDVLDQLKAQETPKGITLDPELGYRRSKMIEVSRSPLSQKNEESIRLPYTLDELVTNLKEVGMNPSKWKWANFATYNDKKWNEKYNILLSMVREPQLAAQILLDSINQEILTGGIKAPNNRNKKRKQSTNKKRKQSTNKKRKQSTNKKRKQSTNKKRK